MEENSRPLFLIITTDVTGEYVLFFLLLVKKMKKEKWGCLSV